MVKQVWVNLKQLQQLINGELPVTRSAGYAYAAGEEAEREFDGSVPLLVGTNKAGKITVDKNGNVLLNIKTDFGKKKDDHAASVPADVQLSESDSDFGGEDTLPGPHVKQFDLDEEIPY